MPGQGGEKNLEPAPLRYPCYLTFLPFLFLKKWGNGHCSSSDYFLLSGGVLGEGYGRTVGVVYGAQQEYKAKQ